MEAIQCSILAMCFHYLAIQMDAYIYKSVFTIKLDESVEVGKIFIYVYMINILQFSVYAFIRNIGSNTVDIRKIKHQKHARKI